MQTLVHSHTNRHEQYIHTFKGTYTKVRFKLDKQVGRWRSSGDSEKGSRLKLDSIKDEKGAYKVLRFWNIESKEFQKRF